MPIFILFILITFGLVLLNSIRFNLIVYKNYDPLGKIPWLVPILINLAIILGFLFVSIHFTQSKTLVKGNKYITPLIYLLWITFVLILGIYIYDYIPFGEFGMIWNTCNSLILVADIVLLYLFYNSISNEDKAKIISYPHYIIFIIFVSIIYISRIYSHKYYKKF